MTDVAPPTEDAPTPDPVQGEAPPVGIRILGQFVRDLSFENPRAPESLRNNGTPPAIELGVEMSARGRADQLFEVDLKLSATATHEGQTSFVVELVYGGVFQLGGVSEQDLEPALLIECPRYLFPFARRIIADVTSDGGFPPFLLDPIDFVAVYQSQRQRAAMDGDGAVGTA